MKGQRLRALVDALLFAAGCAIALVVATRALAPLGAKYALIPGLINAQGGTLDYGCRDADCVRCLSQLRDTSGALVLTGGSSFRVALDHEILRARMPLEVVDCLRNDSRIDAYRLFFAHAPELEASDLVLHAYNSWAINSPGTWRDASAASFFRSVEGPLRPTFLERLQQAHLYGQIFLVMTASAASSEMRASLRVRLPGFDKYQGRFWPLTRETHIRRRVALMKRWFNLSPYVRSFVIEADRVRPADEIRTRHRAFFEALAPARRFVFLPAPEMTDIFPERLDSVIAESRRVMLEMLVDYPNVRHVNVDYRSCGVGPLDFWSDYAGHFDMGHASVTAQSKLTHCIVEAMQRADIPRFMAGE